MRNVCVYCASSTRVDAVYFEAADRLGRILARSGRRLVYGGGSVGLMGALADAALAEGGEVLGVIPEFMLDREWGHTGLTELRVVEDMHVRKRCMVEESDAFVALPGGCGTFEELFEAITWKRLGLHVGPVVLANVEGYFDPAVELLERSIERRFMNDRHRGLWTSVDGVDDVLDAIDNAAPWSDDAIEFAAP